MAKQSYSIKGTNITNGEAVGNQIDRAWFVGIFGLAVVASIASIFINNKKV